jgi:sugar-specific transcriptional regulator TrmB
MIRQRILEKLHHTYGLSHKQVLILKELATGRKIGAEQIARQTAIPIGRFYGYVNELIADGLVSRTTKKPYFYHVPDFNRAVVDYMRSKMQEYSEAESGVLDLMKGAPEEIFHLKGPDEFIRAHLRLVMESKHIRTECFHQSFPYLLYPPDFDQFLKVRAKVIKRRNPKSGVDREKMYLTFTTYQNAVKQGKVFETIVERTTLLKRLKAIKSALTKKEFAEYLLWVQQLLSTNVHIHISEEHGPLEMDIGDHQLVLALRHKDISTGISLRSRAVLKLYTTLFEQRVSRTTNLADEFMGIMSEMQ